MKKGLLLAGVLSMVMAAGVFAETGPLGLTGIGVYGSMGNTAGSFGSGVGISLKWGSFPVVGLQYNVEASRVNATFDYYVIDAEGLASKLSYFLGAGLYAGLASANDEIDFDMGLRATAGLQFWPIKKFELFVAPVIMVPLIPSPGFDLGAEFGARIRF